MPFILDFVMPSIKNLDRLKGLLENIARKQNPYVQHCSETKIQAVYDFDGAMNRYESIVLDILSKTNESESHIISDIDAAKSAMKIGLFQASFIDALQSLKLSYYESVLKPTVNEYLRTENEDTRAIEIVYARAAEIDKIIEVAEFLQKMKLSSS